MIIIASDHGGFELKRDVVKYLKDKKRSIKDLGPKVLKQDDDYPDFAIQAAKKVASSKKDFGILICRNGIGMSIAANKVQGIRAGLCTSVGQAVTARAHTNCNILVLASDYVDKEKNFIIIDTFLEADFSQEERHKRRIEKISEYEEKGK
jgi:ribose 5-phosphate isomerase B